jgi:MSHA pilin protein MshC
VFQENALEVLIISEYFTSMRSFRQSHNHQRGFTMIEIVVVLIILAIMAPFVITRVTTDTNNLITQAEILKSHLRYAQLRALNDTVSWGIYFTGTNSYTLYKSGTTANDLLPGENSQTRTLPTDITITSGIGSTTAFNEWGSPVDAGGTPVTVTQTITLAQGTTTSNITITKNTGFIP